MAIDKGNIKTSANYDVRAQKPMEARREKPRKVDLITKESWSYDGNTVYAHKGLQVCVAEEGKTYVLKDLSKMFEPDYSGWEMLLTDANVAKVATSGQYSDLSGKPTFATVNGKRIDQGGNIQIEGGGGGGGASIPVVSSEEGLGSLSQKKGDLAVVLSEDFEGMWYVPALSLRQATYVDFMMAIQNGTGLPMCDSVDGVQIDSSVPIVPCTSLSNLTVAAFISGDNPLATEVLAIVMPMDADGYPSQAIAVNMITEEEYGVLATYNAATGKLEVDEQVSTVINEYISRFDAKWVYLGNLDTMEQIAANAETNATFSFLKCLAQSVTLGVKSIRVKGDDGYTRFDADVVKIVSKNGVKVLDRLNMPMGAMVRVYAPESVEYDSDWGTLRVPANDDTTLASVVNKVELNFKDNFNSYLLPHIRIIDASGDKQLNILWTADGGLKCNLIVIGLSDTAEEIVLGENGVWNEENLKRIDEMLLSGINILDYVAVGTASLYDSTTGEPDTDIIAAGGAYITPFVTLYCNERQLPERVETYDRLSYGWKKKEEGGSGSGGGASVTVDSAMSDTSTNPVQNKVVKAYVDQAVSGVAITVDADMSEESTNPVQNKIVKAYVDSAKTVVDAVMSDESTNPVQNKVIKAYVDNAKNEIIDEIVKNEDVTAAALVDLNNKIAELLTRLDNAGL